MSNESCKVCQNPHCMHCQTCLQSASSIRGGQCDSCYAATLPGHFNCKECGKAYHASLTGAKLREGLCFKCDFWTEKVEWANEADKMPIRINGVHYQPGLAIHRGGFGGSKFTIQTSDGLFETRNLWCQGDIPERFKDRLPDNAKFVDADCPPPAFLSL